MKSIFYWFISIYALIKNLLGIPKGAIKKRPFWVGLLIQACLFALTIVVMLLGFLVCVPSQMFLWGMDLYLIYKLGNDYGGRLKGQDAQLDSPDEKISISVVIILNHNDEEEVASKKLQATTAKLHNGFYKLSCTVRKCMGYAYYVKNQVTAKDCSILTKVNDERYLTKEAFLECIKNNHMVRPINGKRLWYARIFTQPILWNKRSETNKQLAAMFIFRHCLADGISLIGLLQNFLLREENPELMTMEPRYSATPEFSLDGAYLYRNPFAKKDERRFDVPNADRQLTFHIEDEIQYVPIVKKLKNKLGVGFTEILIAGFTSSLAELLLKRGKSMDRCTMGVLYRPINSDLISIINGTYNYDELTNDSTIIIIYAPVTMKEGSTLIERVKLISAEVEKAKYSVDGLAYYTAGNIIHLLPATLVNYCMRFVTYVTAGATNVGGLGTGIVAGYQMEAAFSFVPYFYETGFRLSIFSKGDRFQLAMAMRQNMLDANEAQTVLNNIFKFIDRLNEEVENG